MLCGATCSDFALCAACLEGLPRLSAIRCPICALPSPRNEVCGACLRHRPAFDRVASPLVYAFPVDTLIQAFKYNGNLAVANLLAPLLIDAIEERPDLIVAMPLSKARLRERGFNQALEISRLVAPAARIPLDPHACRRMRDTLPQTSLPWKERAKNIRGAFACDADLRGKKVAIIDDVMTTGASLNELAGTLRKNGAIEVSAWVAARTLRH